MSRRFARMFRCSLWLGWALLLALTACAAIAAEAGVEVRGTPLQQRYRASDYAGAPFTNDIAAGPDGFVYFANALGLRRFDGSRWERLELPGRSPAMGLHYGRDGSIFIGSYDTFGQLEIDASREMRYRPLLDRFEFAGGPRFGSIVDIAETAQGVFFRSEKQLFLLARDGAHGQWSIPEDTRRLLVIDDTLHARIEGQGLSAWTGSAFEVIEGGEAFADLPIAGVEADPEGAVLVSVRGFHRIRGGRVEPMLAQRAFARHVPNTTLRLPSGSLLIGSETGELLLYGRDLALRHVYPMVKSSIQHLQLDREGGVWFASDTELVRAEIPSPWSAYSESDGWVGAVNDTALFRKQLWIATSKGLYRGRRVNQSLQFVPALTTIGSPFALLAHDDALLIADLAGVLMHRAGQTSRIVADDAVYSLQASSFHDDLVFVLTDQFVIAMQIAQGKAREAARWALGDLDPYGIVETDDDELWVDSTRGGVERWRWDPKQFVVTLREPFADAQGLQVERAFGTQLSSFDDRLVVVSGRSVFRYADSRFERATLAPFSLADVAASVTVIDSDMGLFAFGDHKLWHRARGGGTWNPIPLSTPLAQGISGLSVDADGAIRMVTWAGVLQYEPGLASPAMLPLAVQLRRATREAPDGSSGVLIDAQGEAVLPPDHVARLGFGLVSLSSPPEVRYRIKGLINSWTPWSEGDAQLSLRYPGPGDFVVEVEGRTQSGREAKAIAIPLRAPPRWWQTPLAIGLAAVVASLVTLGLSALLQRFRRERDAAVEAANLDPLTAVLNRRSAQARLRGLVQKAHARSGGFAVLFADIDHFKSVNDRFGHAIGDVCLKVVAARIRAELREGDALARWGGEEFVVLLAGAGAEDAHRIAERIRRRVGLEPISADGEVFPVSASLGVAVFNTDENDADACIARADEALYAAKAAGRDRVMPTLDSLRASVALGQRGAKPTPA